MSDLLRGTPTGSSSTVSMYQPPGSMLGQLAGLGTGIYGLSKFMAEGGRVDSYAGGGVTSQANKEAIVNDTYSIEALMRAKEAALARRDVDTANAIDERIAQLNAMQAQTASLNYGLGNAFDQIPEDRQRTIMAANGGIVAFADGDMVVDPMGTGAGEIYDAPVNPNSLSFLQRITNEPEWKAKAGNEKAKAAASAAVAASNKTDAMRNASRAAQVKINNEKVASAPKQPRVSPVVNRAITQMAEQQGIPKDDFMDMYHKVREDLRAESKEDLKGLQDLIDKQSGKSKEIKEQAFGKALAEYGFAWAAKAAEPGSRFIESASKASPTLNASLAESRKLAAAADENDVKMQIEMRKFNIASRKNDSATAMQAATNMRQLQQSQAMIQQQQAQLAETSRHNRVVEGLTGQRYSAISGNQAMKLAQVKLRARQLGQQRADNFFRNPNNFMAIQDMQKRGITQDALAKKFADEEQQGLLLGMVGTPTLDEE